MKINIRERYQRVSQCLKETGYISRRAIAKVLGISKSSVQRHLTSQFRRQGYPESHFWETTEGQNWLRLLVFGAIYCFGRNPEIVGFLASRRGRIIHRGKERQMSAVGEDWDLADGLLAVAHVESRKRQTDDAIDSSRYHLTVKSLQDSETVARFLRLHYLTASTNAQYYSKKLVDMAHTFARLTVISSFSL